MPDVQPPEGLQPDPILELITSVIPVDPIDGTTIVATQTIAGQALVGPVWGHPSTVAALIRDKLTDAGRLLPPGGEVSTQREWPTPWRHETGTRKVITWPDGSRYVGPFVPDPPPTPEEIEAMRAAVWERVRRVLPNGGRPVVSDNSEASDG